MWGYTKLLCGHHPGGKPSAILQIEGITDVEPILTKEDERYLRTHEIATITSGTIRIPLNAWKFEFLSKNKIWKLASPCRDYQCSVIDVVCQIYRGSSWDGEFTMRFIDSDGSSTEAVVSS